MNPVQRLLRPDCNRVRKVLQSYLDGELDDGQAGVVAAHLADCQRCGIEADVYQRVKDSLARLRPEADPEALARLRRFADTVPADGPDDRDGPT